MSLKLKKKKKVTPVGFVFRSIDTIHNEKIDYFKERVESLPKKKKKLVLMKKKNVDTTELENEMANMVCNLMLRIFFSKLE